jgi:hypothetical protein
MCLSFPHQIRCKQCVELCAAFRKNVQRTSVNLWSQKQMDPIIIVALIVHHTPISLPCDGTLWINAGFSVDRYQLFCEFMCPLEQVCTQNLSLGVV